MSESINLVKAEDKDNLRRQRKIFILRIISLVFIGFVGLVSVILFILYSRISISSVKKDQAQVAQNILFQKDKLAKLNLLNDRLRGINKVFHDRKNYITTLNLLLDQIPLGASAKSLNINKDGISLSISSSSLLPINKFLNNVLDLSSKKNTIQGVIIESLSIDSKSGVYSLAIKAKPV